MAESEPEAKFMLSLSGDGINLEREVDRSVALGVLNVVLGSDTSILSPAGGTAHVGGSGPANPTPSLREYLDKVQASRKPEQIATIGHFIYMFEDADNFTRDDLKSRFSIAREPLPANFARDFAWALDNGWIAEVHGQSGRYYMTAKGMQAVEGRFSADVRRSTTRAKGTGRRRRRGASTRFDDH